MTTISMIATLPLDMIATLPLDTITTLLRRS